MHAYTVRSRYGWGFEVIGHHGAQGWQSHPFESAIDAQTFADHLNAGESVIDTLKHMRQVIEFRGGRFYAA